MSISKSISAAKEATSQSRSMYKSFYAWYDALPVEDREALDRAVLDPTVSARQLFRALKTEEGVPWGDNAFYFYVNTVKQENQV